MRGLKQQGRTSQVIVNRQGIGTAADFFKIVMEGIIGYWFLNTLKLARRDIRATTPRLLNEFDLLCGRCDLYSTRIFLIQITFAFLRIFVMEG